MATLFVQPLSKSVCPSCGASNRPKSKHYVPGLQVCAAGYYSRNYWFTLAYFCQRCEDIERLRERHGLTDIQARSTYALPDWLKHRATA